MAILKESFDKWAQDILKLFTFTKESGSVTKEDHWERRQRDSEKANVTIFFLMNPKILGRKKNEYKTGLFDQG